MTDNVVGLEEVLSVALRLSAVDRLKLVEKVVSSVERELDVRVPEPDQPAEHWGQALNQLMESIGTIELVDPEIEDPVEWVKVQREKERKKRLGDWGE